MARSHRQSASTGDILSPIDFLLRIQNGIVVLLCYFHEPTDDMGAVSPDPGQLFKFPWGGLSVRSFILVLCLPPHQIADR